jgi:hypothetical protein
MPMALPDDPGALSWLADKAWALGAALVAALWKLLGWQHKATREMAATAMTAHKEEDERRFKSLETEQTTQRSHIAKIFDQLRDDARRAEERHRELMQRTHDSHQSLLIAMNSKADK